MKQIYIKNKEYFAYVAKTDNEKIDGLLKFNFLPRNFCMLFDYSDNSQDKSFTMDSMRFSLDLVGVDEFGIIKIIYPNADPNDGNKYFFGQEIKYVVECGSGTIQLDRIEVGDKITIKEDL